MDVQKFEFTSYETDVEINGHIFRLDCSSETGDYLKKSAATLRETADAMGKGEKTADDAYAVGEKMLNDLLGEGAAEKCFEGRKKKLSDIFDICVWLSEVAAKFQQERRKKMASLAKKTATLKVVTGKGNN